MQEENSKKILFTVLGVVLLILIEVGIGTGVYFLNKDKNENINENITENEILKNAKSLNLSDNELKKISDELINNIPFFSIYDLSYDKAATGYNIFESKKETYDFLVNYIMRYDKTKQNITENDYAYSDDNEIIGIKKEFLNKIIDNIFAVEKIKDDTGNEDYVEVFDGGGDTGIEIKVKDKIYNKKTKEYFLKLDFVDEFLNEENYQEEKRTAILTFIEKNNQKLIKSFIYTSDYNDKDNNNSNIDNNTNDKGNNDEEYDCDFNTGNKSYDEELKNHCEKNKLYGSEVYLTKIDEENYGWGENLTFTKNNLEKISEKIMFSLDGGTFDDASKLGGDNLRNILFDFLHSGCGYYSKELLKDTYEYIFGQKTNNVDSIAYDDELTDNFILKCDGRGSAYNHELVSHNDLEYFYKLEDAFEENPTPFYVKVAFKEKDGRYYLVSASEVNFEDINN